MSASSRYAKTIKARKGDALFEFDGPILAKVKAKADPKAKGAVPKVVEDVDEGAVDEEGSDESSEKSSSSSSSTSSSDSSDASGSDKSSKIDCKPVSLVFNEASFLGNISHAQGTSLLVPRIQRRAHSLVA